MQSLHLFAGLAWDPGIRGILTVVLGFAILCGSVWLIVASNTGARLGMLLSVTGLFGWLSILTLFWWISPPAIGPSGLPPSWKVKEIYLHNSNYTDRVNDASRIPAEHGILDQLPEPVDLPTGTEVLEQHPELKEKLVTRPENTTLSDIVPLVITVGDTTTSGADILASDFQIRSANVYLTVPADNATKLGPWKLLSTQASGDAQAAADAALKEAGVFPDATAYRKLNSYETGGNPKRKEECKDDDIVCRATFRLQKTARVFSHPPRYAVVQVQAIVPETARPGEAPPIPKLDTTQPVISVLFERDQGNYRAKPALWFVISFSLFVVFALVLHNRDKVLNANLEAARAAKK